MLRLAIAFSTISWLAPNQPQAPTPRQCILVIPPAQVARAAYIDLAYCMGSCDFIAPGWIILTGSAALRLTSP